MKLTKDEEILDKNFRAKVIQDILSPENGERKNFALRRHEIYRDRIKKWVMEALSKEGLKATTLVQMENRASNINILRKAVNKLARLYLGSVDRSVDSEEGTQAIQEMALLLDFDSKMKKADQYKILFRNCMIKIMPEVDNIRSTDEMEKRKLKMQVLAPWQYDVIEDSVDFEIPRVIIQSEFLERNLNRNISLQDSDVSDGRNERGIVPQFHQGDRVDQNIADSPEDSGMSEERLFIWWNKTFHFTTNQSGEILKEMGPEDDLNLINMLPFCNVTSDQDGQFWAQGGDDLVDGCVLVNQQITDMNSIMYIQGWGQPFISGKNVVEQLAEGGPHTAIAINFEEGDPVPNFEYVSANPPIAEWMKSIEQYVALLMSTNDLAPGNIAGKLDAATFPSGIAAIVEMSQANNSMLDAEKTFKLCERQLWLIISKWVDVLVTKKAAIDEITNIGTLSDVDLKVKFNEMKPSITEEEKLANLERRKKLGLNTQLDLLKIDNPDLTNEDAEKKMKEILEERMENAQRFTNQLMDQTEEKDGDQESIV